MNIPQKIAKEATISFLSMGIGSLFRYSFVLIIARLLGPLYLGIFSLGLAIMRIAEVIGKAGLDNGVLKYVSENYREKKDDQIREIISSSIKIGIILSLLISVILIILSKWLAIDYFSSNNILRNVLVCNAIAIPFSNSMIIIASATQAFKLLKYKAFVINIFVPLLNVIFLFIGLQYSNQVAISVPILLSSILGFILIAVFLQNLISININNIIRAPFRLDLIKFSYPLMFVTIIGTVMHWMDIYMLSFFFDNTTVGMYQPAARTAGLLRIVLIAFMGIFSPMISELYAKNDRKEMQHLYKLIIRWVMTIASPLFLLIIIFPKKVLLLFGPEYQGSHIILSVLTISVLIQSFIASSGHTLMMTGYSKINFVNSVIILIINLLFNFILIPVYGGLGAAIATLISMLSLGLIRLIEVWYYLRLQPVSLSLLKPLFSTLFVFVLLINTKPIFMPFHTIITLLIASLSILIIFTVFLWIMGFDDDDNQVISALKVIFLNTK